MMNVSQRQGLNKLVDSKTHGLLMYSGPGGGKTLVSLKFVALFPEKKLVIICSEKDVIVWKKHLQKIAVKNNTTFIIYEKIKEKFNYDFTKKILIIDKSEVLRKYIQTKFTSVLFSSFKTILLTDSFFENNFIDTIYSINIAAGKFVIPYQTQEFEKNFFKDNLFKKVLIDKFLFLVKKLETLVGDIGIISWISVALFPYFYPDIKDKTKLYYKTLYKQGISINDILKISYNFSITVAVLSIFSSVLRIIEVFSEKESRKLNTDKLTQIISPYVHKLSFVEKGPFIKNTIIKVPYDYQQTIQLINGMTSKVSLFLFEKKFEKIFYIGNQNSKFNKILDYSIGKRSVFYSGNYELGTLPFINFLSSKNIKYICISPGSETTKKLQNFKNQDTFLIIHPDFDKNIIIPGASQLHFIEPSELVSTKRRIIYYTANSASHSYLPEAKRSLEVIVWVSETSSKLNQFFPSKSSPDNILLKNQKQMCIMRKEIQKSLEKL